jgi:hypothetical protein
MTNIFQALDLVFFFCSQEVETNSNGWVWRWLSQRAGYEIRWCLWANCDLDKYSKFLQKSWNLSEHWISTI